MTLGVAHRPGTVLRAIAAAPAGLAVVLLALLPGPRWAFGLVAAIAAAALAIAWIRWPRPTLATGALLAIVGGLAAHPVPAAMTMLIALCAGAFLLSAEAAEQMTWAESSRRETPVAALFSELARRLATRRRAAFAALIGIAALGIGTVLPITAAPIIAVAGAIAIALLGWWAAAPRWPR